MARDYQKAATECLENGDYKGQLENARLQYERTKSAEDKSKRDQAQKQYETHLLIQRIIKDAAVSHYKVLGVPETASSQEIKRAFQSLIYLCHPSRTAVKDGSKAAECLVAAFEALKDEERRAQYNQKRKNQCFTAGSPFGSQFRPCSTEDCMDYDEVYREIFSNIFRMRTPGSYSFEYDSGPFGDYESAHRDPFETLRARMRQDYDPWNMYSRTRPGFTAERPKIPIAQLAVILIIIVILLLFQS